jgi:phosphoribosylglycinamide formyltransferase-1
MSKLKKRQKTHGRGADRARAPAELALPGRRVRPSSEAENKSGVSEQVVKTRLIEAQSAAIPRGIASICNDERACFGGMSGHGGFVLSLSGGMARKRRRGECINPSAMKNIVILISGTGSNMAAIVRAARREGWAGRLGARVAAVISNRPGAAGLQWAAGEKMATAVVDHKNFAGREAFDAALTQAIDAHDPALVVLAGFMRILTPGFVAHYAGRIVNIHPSLLPAFPGLHTHQRAIDAGCKLAGATVHRVTAELDHGEILAQAAVPVLPGDTADTLAARVLTQEHLIYPRAVARLMQI